MNDEELFPDYKPKKTPDTVCDYLRKPDSFVFKIIEEIKQPHIEKLKKILDYFHKYKIAAERNPGGYQKGNVAIGADLEQYYPSEEEILVSELGKLISSILNSNSKEKINRIKEIEGIEFQKIVFNEIYFRHVDVMGSGRFFYAEKKEPQIKIVF